MRRVLVIAYYFPPIAGIGSIRLESFARHLPEFGWEPTVLAPRDTPHPRDPSLCFPESSVVRSRSLEPSRIARALPGPGADDARVAGSPAGAARAAAKRMIYPDPQIGWYPGAAVAGLRALRSGSFDAVFSSSFPITAHLVARTLTRREGLAWVAEFRDPWSDTLGQDHPHRRRAAKLENRIAGEASGVIMPTPTWAAHYGAAWKTDIAVVPNGHEIGASPTPPPATPTLTHLGSFYPGRQSLASLWQALRRLEHDGHPPPRIQFIGELHPEVQAEAAAAGVGELIEATGQVPHDEARRLLGESSMLFASGQAGSDAIARGWVPAKLFEYLASGLPVLYLGDRAGDAGAMLAAQPGCYVVEADDVDAVASALRIGLKGKRHGRDVCHLSRRAAASRLAAILDDAVLSTPR